jgi:osmoprotectant transport system substrate-binding protein
MPNSRTRFAVALALAGASLLPSLLLASPATAKTTTKARTAAALAVEAAKQSSLPTIVIGSENFPEEIVLGNLYNDVLVHAGFKTQLHADLGGRPYVDEALAHKALDLFPDYAGSLLAYLKPGEASLATQLSTDIPALKKALLAQGATVLNPAPAVDTNVFVVTKATAAKYHLKAISDLQPVAKQLVFGAPPECPKYEYCGLGLKNVYHLHFKSFVATDESGPIAVADLRNGKVQVVELFSTDSVISQDGFVVLADNKHLEPADHIIPVIRRSFDTPGVAKALNALSAKLTTNALAQLDTESSTNHDPAADAAKWLKQTGLT